MNDVAVTTADGQIRIERNSGTWYLLTTRVHSDQDLLDQLQFALRADHVSFCGGGYNVRMTFHHPPRMSTDDMLAISSDVVTTFYADAEQFVVSRNTEQDRLDCLCPTIEFALNRRFEYAARKNIERELCQLSGVAGASFYYGGNRLWVQLPNHLFDIDEVAEAAIQVVTEHGKIFDA